MPVSKKRKIEDSLGPYCDNLGITKSKLKEGKFLCDSDTTAVSNGAILEILKLWRQQRGDDTLLEKYLNCCFQDGSFEIIKSATLGLWSKRESMRIKKDREGISQLEMTEFDSSAHPYVPPPPTSSVHSLPPECSNAPREFQHAAHVPNSDTTKASNFLHHQIAKQQKHLQTLQNCVRDEEERRQNIIDHCNAIAGQYSPHNVKRRDRRAGKNLKALSKANRTIRQLQAKVSALERVIGQRARESENVRKLQRKLSYYRNRDKVKKADLAVCLDCEKWKGQINVLEAEIAKRDAEPHKQSLLNFFEDGEVRENVRLAILELIALDVATGKVCDVIEVVARHLFNAHSSNIPSRKTVQNIVDAGQYIAKTYVSKEVLETDGLGIAKDGTTRRKVKIQETNVILSNGKHYSLGFSSLPSETGEALHKDVEIKLDELAAVADDSNFKKEALQKLTFLISDRAANEKKSNRIIKEWCSLILETSQPHHQVQEYFCMAHVLLAFHSYSLKELKTLGDDIGMDFSASKNSVEKFLKYTSDIFAPVGDYRGVRDVWLEDCRQKGVKSIVTNYKDNRFNGLFHVSGQIFYHRLDFVRILECHKNSNFRQTTVLTALKNEKFILLLKCFGLFYYKITGPYWIAVTSGRYSYPQMGAIVRDLHAVMVTWKDDPANILSPSVFRLPQLPTPSDEFERSPKPEDKNSFFNYTSVIAEGFLKALDAQCGNFLAEDTSQPSGCNFAPATNLVCERGLGMLDASQRMRPNASLHHHSTVVALKQTRGGMQQWLKHLPAPVRRLLWQKARKGGKELRDKHRARDLQTQRESHRLSQLPQKSSSSSGNGKSQRSSSRPIQALNLPSADEGLSKDDWIAVAYPQTWYTGLVLQESAPGSAVLVDFGEPSKGLGCFKYPDGKDIQEVDRCFILRTKVTVSPAGNLRYWITQNSAEIEKLYRQYVKVFKLTN